MTFDWFASYYFIETTFLVDLLIRIRDYWLTMELSLELIELSIMDSWPIRR